jgi:hypothetical protein
VARTDRDIGIARGEKDLSVEEMTDLLPTHYDLKDPEIVKLLDWWAEEALNQGWMNREQTDRYVQLLHGQEEPREHLTTEELITLVVSLKSPAQRTSSGWMLALNEFLGFAELTHPTAATRKHAIDYRTHLLEHRMASSAET